MSDAVHSAAETAEEHAAALLAAAVRAADGRHPGAGASLSALIRPEHYKLSEVERLTVRRLLKGLVETVEADLRARLLNAGALPDVEEFTASLGAAHVAIAWPMLSQSGLPDDRALAELLVRRSRTFAIGRQLRRNAVSTENGRLETLTDHGDDAIAADAMDLLIAESRTNDRFDDPKVMRSDLSDPSDRQLVWTVAAALRRYGVQLHGIEPSALDPAIADTTTAMLGDRGDMRSLEGIAMQLAGRLHRADLADDALLVETLNSARLTLYVALLAARGDLPFGVAWEMAVLPDAPSHMLLLKSLGVAREAASHLLVAMTRALLADDRLADERAAEWVQSYDRLQPADIERAMRSWRLDRDYRDAIAALRGRSFSERGVS
ncbi:DUF2336 domain-containing protein [Parasphingopyxis sp.]|uniref:DUF2336 domain-containing protein n=1 Tax=Parasphingopyxis sp. TaxID=1920299 RepID=UPI002615B1F0|nr:DUF2336 domain-containing protein [Parasphingopyxis sp.]